MREVLRHGGFQLKYKSMFVLSMEIFYCDIVCLINDTVEFSVSVGEVLTQSSTFSLYLEGSITTEQQSF